MGDHEWETTIGRHLLLGNPRMEKQRFDGIQVTPVTVPALASIITVRLALLGRKTNADFTVALSKGRVP